MLEKRSTLDSDVRKGEYHMRKIRLLTSILLIIVLLGNMSSIAFAHEVDGEDTIGEIINGSDFLNEDLQP